MRHPPRRLRDRIVALGLAVALAAAAGACGGDDDDADDAAGGVGAGATLPAGGVPPTAADTGASPLCDAYLAFLAVSAEEIQIAIDDLAGALGPGAGQAVLDALAVVGPTPPEGTTPEDFVAALQLVRDAVVPACAQRYQAGVVPAATDADALTAFAESLIAGDRDAASLVAPADVLALFEPWQAYPEDPTVGAPSYVLDAEGVSIVLAATYSVRCSATGGVVDTCGFGE